MESPLDVLSRAASLVETCSRNKDDSYLGSHPSMEFTTISNSNEGRSPSPPGGWGKQLTTKLVKQERHRERLKLATVLITDQSHADQLSQIKKSASTQTQFSSFQGENVPPPPYFSPHQELTSQGRLHQYPAQHISQQAISSPPAPLSTSAPPYPSATSSPLCHNPMVPPQTAVSSSSPAPSLPHSNGNALPPPPPSPSTVPSYSHNTFDSNKDTSTSPPIAPHPPPPAYPSSSPPSSRPALPPPPPSFSSSPHKRAPPPLSLAPPYPGRSPPHYGDLQSSPLNLSVSRPSLMLQSQAAMSTSQQVTITSTESEAQVSDEAIEEHFRRSLGQKYSDPVSQHTNSSSDQTTVFMSQKQSSVDDHFARALGDKYWEELKAQMEPVDTQAGTVDAHFAKALGATTWRKLRAEAWASSNISPNKSPDTNRQQVEEVHSRPSSQSGVTSPSYSPIVT